VLLPSRFGSSDNDKSGPPARPAGKKKAKGTSTQAAVGLPGSGSSSSLTQTTAGKAAKDTNKAPKFKTKAIPFNAELSKSVEEAASTGNVGGCRLWSCTKSHDMIILSSLL